MARTKHPLSESGEASSLTAAEVTRPRKMRFGVISCHSIPKGKSNADADHHQPVDEHGPGNLQVNTILDETGREIFDLTALPESSDEEDEEDEPVERDGMTRDLRENWWRETSPGWCSIHGVDVCERECFPEGDTILPLLTLAYLQFAKFCR